MRNVAKFDSQIYQIWPTLSIMLTLVLPAIQNMPRPGSGPGSEVAGEVRAIAQGAAEGMKAIRAATDLSDAEKAERLRALDEQVLFQIASQTRCQAKEEDIFSCHMGIVWYSIGVSASPLIKQA